MMNWRRNHNAARRAEAEGGLGSLPTGALLPMFGLPPRIPLRPLDLFDGTSFPEETEPACLAPFNAIALICSLIAPICLVKSTESIPRISAELLSMQGNTNSARAFSVKIFIYRSNPFKASINTMRGSLGSPFSINSVIHNFSFLN
jgi:hypothetical protein